MKKIISVLLALLLSSTLAFSVIACDNSGESESLSGNESMESGTNGESGGQQNSETQIKSFDYIYLDGNVVMNNDDKFKADGKVWVDLSDGLDYIFKGKSEDSEEYIDYNYYSIDGYTLRRSKEWNKDETEPEKYDDCAYYGSTSDDMLQSSSDESVYFAYVVSYLIENRGKFGYVGLGNTEINVDVKEILNEVNAYIQENKDKSLLTLAAEIAGVKEEVLETAIKTICVNNVDGDPVTVADLINRLCLVFKADLKSIFDELQVSSLLSTQEVVNEVKAFVKENVDKNDYDEIAPILFPDVIEEETLYDYLLRVANNFSVDKIISAIVGNDAPTLEDLGTQVTSILKNTDLKTFIAYVASNISLNSSNCVDSINDFVTECVNTFEITLKLTVDEYGYPTCFEFAFDVDYDATAFCVSSSYSSRFAKVDTDIKAVFNIEYSETPFEGVKFEFPSDTEYKPFFKYCNFYLTEEELFDAKQNGFEVEYVNGTGKYAEMKLEISSDFDYRNLYTGLGYKSEVLYDTKMNEIARIEYGKVVLTKDYFEILGSNGIGFLALWFGDDYERVYFVCENSNVF